MSDLRSFALPDVGEGLTEAEILRWDVAVGDRVEVNTVLVEIETAKASVELPCPFAGVIAAIHVAEGAIVPVGTPLVSIAVEGRTADAPAPAEPAAAPGAGAPADGPGADGPPAGAPARREAVLVGYGVQTETPRRRRARVAPAGSPAPAAPGSTTAPRTGRVRAKPPVRKLARDLRIDLTRVVPTGRHGEVTRADVMTAHSAVAAPAGTPVPVRGVRRAMAVAMAQSAATAPQASVWLEVDLTGATARLTQARARAAATGVRVTLLALVAQALLRTVRDQPLLNAAWHEGSDGPVVVLPDRIGLGIATDTPRGLLVPVVADPPVDDAVALAERIQRSVDSARSGQASVAELTGGTVTITNVGVLGVDGGIPILTPGQSAILAMGRASERPWVVDGQVVVRPVMQLTLTFDHRVLDGAQAGAALAAIAAHLG